MPIDPSIPLGFRNPQIQVQNPLAQYAQAQELNLNALKMQEAQQSMETRNMLRTADPSSPDYIDRVFRADPKLGLELLKNRATIKKEEGITAKNAAELEGQYVKNSRNTLVGVNDQAAYDSWRTDTISKMPGLAQVIPAQFSPQVKTALLSDAETYLKQNTISEYQRKSLDLQAQGQNKPVFSADYGGFVVPPSKNAPQGSFIPVTGPTGAPLESSKPLTEGQAKGVGFALRAREADQVLNTIGKSGEVQPGVFKRVLESTPFIGEGLGTMANVSQSAEQQQVEQAQRNFVNAVLRQESGAVINEDEFNNAKKQYFPQPGDSDAVIKQKEQARKTTIKALETQAGPGLRRAGGGKAEDPLGIR
jgi:hypothetical protein